MVVIVIADERTLKFPSTLKPCFLLATTFKFPLPVIITSPSAVITPFLLLSILLVVKITLFYFSSIRKIQNKTKFSKNILKRLQ